MQLVFIGSGSAFTLGSNNFHSNMLLINENSEKKLLIDCGSDARHALHQLNYTHKDITDVYISHLHADHAGGLEWLALTRKFDPSCTQPNLFANSSIMHKIWNATLAGGLSTIQGVKAQLDTFFHLHPIENDSSFIWDNIEFQIIQTIHVVAGYSFMPSYGLIFKVNGRNVFITTDTQFAPNQLHDFYHMADIIFQDCETTTIKSGVHAHYSELCSLPIEIKEKMWLYHYNPGQLPDAAADKFCGFVQPGQLFQL